jgi:GMP synthase PP-ATPase subunit
VTSFPGPGLSIRILGDITLEKVQILQDVDKVLSMVLSLGIV